VRVAGVTVRVAIWPPPYCPVIVTNVELETTLVDTVKVTVFAPAGTSTPAGTCAELLLLDKVTVSPPAGATPLSVTVPTELFPPTTVIGVTITVDRTIGGGKGTGAKVRVALFVVLL
jgi:hypothetical protein